MNVIYESYHECLNLYIVQGSRSMGLGVGFCLLVGFGLGMDIRLGLGLGYGTGFLALGHWPFVLCRWCLVFGV